MIIETLGGGCGINSLGNESGDVDDAFAPVDACFDMIADSHR